MPVVGMIGGGQLARMTHQAAIPLGQSLRVLAAAATDPAALVAPGVTVGMHTDPDAVRAFAADCDVVTFDHEHVPGDLLRGLVAEGVAVRPGPDALIHAQDKLVMRRRLRELGLPVPEFAEVTSPADLVSFGEEHGWPSVVKAVRGGYDGRGVWMPADADEAVGLATELLAAGTPLMVEQKVPMRRELAAVVARSPFGQGAAWPVVRTVQSDGICVEVHAPAPGLSTAMAAKAQEIAFRIADELDVVGVLAVELFELDLTGRADEADSGWRELAPDGLVVNELAMRPHNSGHWTIEGARTSQFEQHLRAVLDYPLGNTDPVAPAAVMTNVLGAPEQPAMSVDERLHHLFARYPDAKVHLYGKTERPGRKVGHVTMLGDDVDAVAVRARLAAHWLSHARWTDGYDIHGGEQR
ncbi:N5-carboxyaminoimidazole ribonucleotide synthase [Actinoalloteichus hoggarensis]|uniref:N5-carboxyaminoimidazole ribonucleotide synthase n=2 Tax=Actinoalloteichus hoggarensis TaxID=1470176 RepID=A0A221W942_9PSEU|nr:N5-carboxyaminoimidazole ribonucleotide synthase [Actinoalloteichus hoggarensis]